jgi:serine/threonine protein kinase
LNPERWHQISRIFKSAISLESEARDAYVANQCAGDESLRSEVEKLIESHRQASTDNFIGGRAADEGAVLLLHDDEIEPERTQLKKGQQFGSYLIIDKLGAGGMGEVYLATDSRLERTVALKILPQDISADKRRMQRFHQEARVASSLNQPNILTIYEFGEVDGLAFLATEFIDGETLRNYLRGKRLKLTEILDIAIQILAALDAAHEARIVHRDIKPENVMIRRRDSVVKVLDFGLAKVTEKKPAPLTNQEFESEAVTAFKTAPGLLMGTVNYMSPEQALTRPVDERTDIWSAGVLLYEMVTGLMPFGGPTTGHTLVQILEKEVPAFPKVAEAPPELQRIIRKAMAKNPDERYQTAKDLAVDLRSLRRELDHGSGLVPATEQTEKEPDKKRVLAIVLVAIVLVAGAFLTFALWRASRVRSTGVVTNTGLAVPQSTPAPGPERTLTYWITVQKFRKGKYQKPYTVGGEINFEARDQIRLNVRTTQPGHLYILSEGPRDGAAVPEFVILFPSRSANNGSQFLAADQQVLIPEKTWLEFDEQAGVERLWLVFAEIAVPELESVKEFANEQTRGLITDMTRNRLVNDFLTSPSAAKPDVDRGDTLTTLKARGKLLLYPVRLEHH